MTKTQARDLIIDTAELDGPKTDALLTEDALITLRRQELEYEPGLMFGYFFSLKRNGRLLRRPELESPF
jgi:hypothetical protein